MLNSGKSGHLLTLMLPCGSNIPSVQTALVNFSWRLSAPVEAVLV